jgi:hypothetical protein
MRMTREERNQLNKLTGVESLDSPRYYSTKGAAARRAETLRGLYPTFFFHVDKFDVQPAASQGLYKFAVVVDHQYHPNFNNPSARPMRCV